MKIAKIQTRFDGDILINSSEHFFSYKNIQKLYQGLDKDQKQLRRP